MKQLTVIVVTVFLFSSCCSSRVVSINTEQLPSLQEVVNQVQLQYERAVKRLADEHIDNIKITEAAVTLKVAKAAAGSGEIKVIVKASKERTLSKSTSVTYTLTQQKNTSGAGKQKFADTNIEDVIYSAAKEFNSLQNPLSGLIKDNFEVDIVFSLEDKTGVGLSFEVWGVGVDAGVDLTNSVEHEIKLTFGYVTKAK